MFSSNLSLDLLQDQRLWELLLLKPNAADVWRTQESQGYICWNTSLKTPTTHHHLHHSMRIMGIKTGIWIWSRATVCGTQHIYDGCFLVKLSFRQTMSNCSIVLRLLKMLLTHDFSILFAISKVCDSMLLVFDGLSSLFSRILNTKEQTFKYIKKINNNQYTTMTRQGSLHSAQQTNAF